MNILPSIVSPNKSSILFWDPDTNPLKGEAKPFYRPLREVNVLHDTLEQAVDAVRSANDDVEKWWNVTERCRAVQAFCHWSARISSDAIERWHSFFNMIRKGHFPSNVSGLRNIFLPPYPEAKPASHE